MTPAVLAQQMRQGVEDFLRTTFPISTPFFHGMLDRLLAGDGEVFKGPYLSIQLPFRQGTGGPDFFPDIPLPFKPYVHREQAFPSLRAAATFYDHRDRHGLGKNRRLLIPDS
jgi:DEAD/DEAH box helicase domain-containing protein